MDTEQQLRKDDIVDVYDEIGRPLYMQAVVLTDEAADDTHIRVEYMMYPGGLARIERQYLRFVSHG